ncbi:MAG: Slam-dependent surface lipoprotein [Luteimonas sp.]
MNTKQKLSVLSLAIGMAFAAGAANADPFVGGSSNQNYVKVGKSIIDAGPHDPDLAGIGVNATGVDNFIDFQGLTAFTTKTVENGQTVHQLDFPYTGSPESHDNLGVFAFVQAGDLDVWAGEWYSRKDNQAGLDTHMVYYIGDEADASITSTGQVDYTVAGLSDYSGGNLLSGTFTANFAGGTGTLTGSIATSDFSQELDIGTVAINQDASITGNGTATAFSGTNTATGGDVSGQFYSGQAALAGIATFTDNQYDTAFVGTRD